MKIIAILMLVVVCFERISEARRIVYKSPAISSHPSAKKDPPNNGIETITPNAKPSSNKRVVRRTYNPVLKPAVSRIDKAQEQNKITPNLPMPGNPRTSATGKAPCEMGHRSKLNYAKDSPSTKPVLLSNRNQSCARKVSNNESKTSSNSSIPYLQKGKDNIIKGENGKIFVDDVFMFDIGNELKSGKLRIRVNRDNDVFINGRLVMRKRPQDTTIVRLDPQIEDDGITDFKFRINKYGVIYYSNGKFSKVLCVGK